MAQRDREVLVIKNKKIKIMKGKLFFLIVFFKINFCSCLFAQDHSKDTLYVESVDFNILTYSSISCGNFTSNFRERISFRVIANKDTTAKLDSFLSKIKYARRDMDVDVRAKLIFERGDQSRVTICTNGYDILIDNRLIKHNSKFADFLGALTMQNRKGKD
jgi:hypothetical protein